ncbi:MAG: putative oxidoreductase [Woeseiaceae bacterium]|jgi:putative oxidoreductase
MFEQLNALQPRAHWLLRVAFGSVFIFHGVGKVASFAAFSGMMGLSVPVAALVTFAEIAAGFGIIIGGFGNERVTRLAGLAAIPVLLGAIFMVHGPRWSFVATEEFPMGGMEFQVVLLLIATYFLIAGNEQSHSS